MEITWYGHSCFRMMERGVASIVADPYAPSLGYGEPNLRADIVTVSHDAPGHSAADSVKRAEHLLDRPGEYEIGGVFITGIMMHDPNAEADDMRRNVAFVYDFDGLTIAHLGDLSHVPSQQEIEQFGPVNVLLVPVGGGNALNSAQASEVISRIEPSLVVPMHYQTDEVNMGLEPLEKFLKEMGVSAVEEQDSLKVTSSSLGDETSIVVLNRAS